MMVQQPGMVMQTQQQTMQPMMVNIPPGMGAGSTFVVNTGSGMMQVQVPLGLPFGTTTMQIMVPRTTTQLVVVQQPAVQMASVPMAQIVPENPPPAAPAPPAAPEPEPEKKSKDNIEEGEMIVCHGLLCCNTSLYFHNCVGCSGMGEFLCIKQQCCCKLEGVEPYSCACGEAKEDPNLFCQLSLCCIALGCKRPTVCCKAQEHCCCVVTNCTLPADDEMPMTCAFCGIQCYPACGCCKKLKDLKEQRGAPSSLEMDR